MSAPVHKHHGDFGANRRVLAITVLAALIGAISVLTADLLLHLIRLFTNVFFFGSLSFANRVPADSRLGAWAILMPAAGGIAVGLLARYGSEAIRGHGIPEAIEAILFKKSAMTPKIAILKPLASAIAIGSGGPFGAEGPIIMTGGAAGSLIAQHVHVSAGERKALLVAGAAAGMTAIFGTPIAAVLLAVELLLFELRPRSLLPVAVACAVAGFARPFFIASGPLFPLQTPELGTSGLVSCIAVGVLGGMLSWALSSGLYAMEDRFAKLPIHWMWWPALGGLAVGIGGFFQPRALGVGYDAIDDLLHRHMALDAIAALIAVKTIVWTISLASGTSGGVLAPLLMIGAGMGALLAPLLPGGDPAIWPLIGMAAVLGGMMRAPVMSVLFAFELTHDMGALLPLLASSATAYGFTVLVMKRSVLTEKIARRGYHIYREYAVDPLDRFFVRDVMTRTVETIEAETPLGEAAAAFFGPQQRHRAFPVVRAGNVAGMLDLAAVAAARKMHGDDAPVARALMSTPPPTAHPGETCRSVSNRLAAGHLERLPVVDEHGRLAGIISRSDLVKPSLAHVEEEERHERLLRLAIRPQR